MRKKILSYISCPNKSGNDFKIFAVELIRDGETIKNVDNSQILDTDDIKTGIVISNHSYAYPINNFIGIFLKDDDCDKPHLRQLFNSLLINCPEEYKAAISKSSNRIHGITETGEGNWNREEMKYYDAEVDSEDLRVKMLNSIKGTPIWRIFIPRKENIIDRVSSYCRDQNVLEIGCGNARTVAREFNPADYHFNYIGTDISFKRLIVAKQTIPEGDFIQASAINLPFKESTFNLIISFGMLHHLPAPQEAIKEAHSKLLPKGFFGLHEPVYTSRNNNYFMNKIFRKLFRTYEHSSHDNKINLKDTLNLLKSLGHDIINYVPFNSLFRVIFESLVKKINKNALNNRYTITLLLRIDNFLLNTICKLSDKLGPQAVIIVSQKPG